MIQLYYPLRRNLQQPFSFQKTLSRLMHREKFLNCRQGYPIHIDTYVARNDEDVKEWIAKALDEADAVARFREDLKHDAGLDGAVSPSKEVRLVIGVDIKWTKRHDYDRRRYYQQMSLLQLATDRSALVIQLKCFSRSSIKKTIQQILLDENILKVGVDIHHNLLSLRHQHGKYMSCSFLDT